MNKINLQFTVLALIIFLAAFSRIIPHPANFSPLMTIGLFGAAHFAKRWQAWVIPLVAVWLSDLFVTNVIFSHLHPEFTWFYSGFYWQYIIYILIVPFGIWLFKKKISFLRVLGGALGAGILFFLISNFGMWASQSLYPKTLSGLLTCYAAAIPFFKGTLAGNLFFSTALFGGYYLLQRYVAIFRLKHVVYA